MLPTKGDNFISSLWSGCLSFSGNALDLLYNPEQDGERGQPCLVKGTLSSVSILAVPLLLLQCGNFPGEDALPGKQSGASGSKVTGGGGQGKAQAAEENGT